MYDDNYSGVFEAKFGFAQGDEDSPLGYVIFKDMLISYISSRKDLNPPSINGKPVPINCYADDIRGYSRSTPGAQNFVHAVEIFLLLFRGSLSADKSLHSAILWQFNPSTNKMELIEDTLRLTTQDGSLIPYASSMTAVKDLGFKTSLDLSNTEQLSALQQQLDYHASRLNEPHQMSVCGAFLIDSSIHVP